MYKKSFVKIAWLVISLLAAACGGGGGGSSTNAPVAFSEGDVVSSSSIGSIQKADIASMIQSVGLPTNTLKYDADCYALTYKTPDITNALVDASGLVCLPKGKSGSSPLISYQHGTIYYKADAPISSGSRYFWTGAALASSGYIAVVPDYLGYGVSSSKPHPYMNAKNLSSTIVNMLRASKSFLSLPAINTARNGQLFLAGYSEGGYATLAVQKKIELELASEFTVTASEPGAGAYDLSGTLQSQATSATIFYPANAAFLVKSYDMMYNNPSLLSYYFTPAKVALLDSLFSGNLPGESINSALGGSTIAANTLFNQVFLDSFNAGGESLLKSFAAQNDIYNWKPSAPTIFFHGPDDDQVPYANATRALQVMQANGSISVSLHNCNAGSQATTHANCGWPYVEDMMNTFSAFAAGL